MVQWAIVGTMVGGVYGVCGAGGEVTYALVGVCVCLGMGRCYISGLIGGFSSPWSSWRIPH